MSEINQIAEKIETLVAWYGRGGLSQDDRTVIGDMTDLYQRGAIIRNLIDGILTLQHSDRNKTEARSRLAHLVAEVDNLGAIVRDLSGPLRRLTYGADAGREV